MSLYVNEKKVNYRKYGNYDLKIQPHLSYHQHIIPILPILSTPI